MAEGCVCVGGRRAGSPVLSTISPLVRRGGVLCVDIVRDGHMTDRSAGRQAGKAGDRQAGGRSRGLTLIWLAGRRYGCTH